MSANSGQLNSNEDSEVMVRQVNLAAAFHDHISCTKISQHSIGTGICGLQTSVSDIGDHQNASIGSIVAEISTPFESDHIYATESKPFNDNSLSGNGCIRPNLFGSSLSDERNQISKLTEMILGQLDLIQHQQEQLLKKDRQLQGLKQDREALCLRLEKMEKRIAVLTVKVANNNNNTNVNNNNTTNSLNNNTINSNRSLVTNSQSSTNTIETDCEQSGSDTIVEESNGVIGLFTDPTIFTKLYSKSSAVNSVNSSTDSVNNSTMTPKIQTIDTTSDNSNENNNFVKIEENNLMAVQIKTELVEEEEQEVESISKTTSRTTTTSSTISRKSRKRHIEEAATVPSTSQSIANRKRSKTSISSDNMKVEIKKEKINTKETSCDSLSTLSTTQTNNSINKTLTNIKKKVVKQKCETSSKPETTHISSGSNCRNISLTRDVLMTSTPYAIVVNNSHLSLELNVNVSDVDDSVDNKTVSEDSSLDVIEVPKYRLHPVSSCYSLEGTEDLDDEVFNRRHMKLENDERRRKRWDIQRLREHRYNEKLRTGRYYNSNLNNCFVEKPSDLKKKATDFKSFYPELKNVQAIEVSEKIPYISFGHPVPKMPTKFFSLPWNSTERTHTTAKDRKTPHKKY